MQVKVLSHTGSCEALEGLVNNALASIPGTIVDVRFTEILIPGEKAQIYTTVYILYKQTKRGR